MSEKVRKGVSFNKESMKIISHNKKVSEDFSECVNRLISDSQDKNPLDWEIIKKLLFALDESKENIFVKTTPEEDKRIAHITGGAF